MPSGLFFSNRYTWSQIFWELKAKQKGYEYNRYEGEDRMAGFKQIAYDDEYLNDIEKLIEEREEI